MENASVYLSEKKLIPENNENYNRSHKKEPRTEYPFYFSKDPDPTVMWYRKKRGPERVKGREKWGLGNKGEGKN